MFLGEAYRFGQTLRPRNILLICDGVFNYTALNIVIPVDKQHLSGIYAIMNKINNKLYIGSAVHFKRRHGDHRKKLLNKSHYNKKLQHAVNKYGINNFSFILVELCDKKELFSVEQKYLNRLFRTRSGYNINPTAGGPKGHTEHTKKKLSKLLKDKPPLFKGRKHTDESKRLNSIKHKGRKPSTESIKKSIETRQKNGYRHSDETKKKISERQIGKPWKLTTEQIKQRQNTFKETWSKNKVRVDEVCVNCKTIFQKFPIYKNKVLCSSCWKKLIGRKKISDESRLNMSKVRIGKKHTESHKNNISKGMCAFKKTGIKKRYLIF